MEPVLRLERPANVAAIHAVNVAAFPTDVEARLVDALRAAGALTLSLVAETASGVIGHLAFSPVTVTGADGSVVVGQGLAPMAVVPAAQRTGLGTALVEGGLHRLRAAGHRFCVVLGHPSYYPRFGFVPATRFGLRCEYDAPDDAFLALALGVGGLTGVTGLVRFRPEFAEV